MRQNDLAELLRRTPGARARPRLSPSGNTESITGFTRPDDDEVEHGLEVVVRAHRRAVDRQLLPPHAVQVRGRVRARRRAAHADPAGGPRDRERRLPRVRADGLDDDVHAAARELLHARGDVLASRGSRSRRRRARRARSSFSSDDDVTTARAPSAFTIASDAVATPPPMPQIEHPLVRLQRRLRDEHSPGGLEDERERRRLLERERVGDRVDVRLRHRDQLGVRPVHVLADRR